MSAFDANMVPSMITPARPKVRPSPRHVKLSFDPNKSKTQVLFRIMGTALVIGAPVMLVVPGMIFETELVAVRFGGALFFLLCGLALLMRNHADALPEVQVRMPLRRGPPARDVEVPLVEVHPEDLEVRPGLGHASGDLAGATPQVQGRA